jgi:hypothetical protein
MSGMIKEFEEYCMLNKSRSDLGKIFYGSMNVNSKECRDFKLTSDQWRYVIRRCLLEKTKLEREKYETLP